MIDIYKQKQEDFEAKERAMIKSVRSKGIQGAADQASVGLSAMQYDKHALALSAMDKTNE